MLAHLFLVGCGRDAMCEPLAETVAVSDFRPTNVSASEAAAVSGFVRGAVVRSGRFTVVDKGNMEKILAEQAFQQTGCTSQDCAVKLGHLLNVQTMIIGEYTVIERNRYLSANMVNVETGRIEQSASVKGFDAANVDEAAQELVNRLIAGQPSDGARPATLPAPPASHVPEGWGSHPHWTVGGGYGTVDYTYRFRMYSQLSPNSDLDGYPTTSHILVLGLGFEQSPDRTIQAGGRVRGGLRSPTTVLPKTARSLMNVNVGSGGYGQEEFTMSELGQTMGAADVFVRWRFIHGKVHDLSVVAGGSYELVRTVFADGEYRSTVQTGPPSFGTQTLDSGNLGGGAITFGGAGLRGGLAWRWAHVLTELTVGTFWGVGTRFYKWPYVIFEGRNTLGPVWTVSSEYAF